ncbi:MAG: cytosine/uracil/thiamine/allantoin permease [Ulvibacter sp.]|jgi:cytosine/uracil/thiamine/allantoin permease
MFKKVINHDGFWRSVVSLAIAFALLFILVKWAISGFESAFFSQGDPVKLFAGVILAGFVYGFFVTFGKFRAKIKNQERK